MKKSLTYIAMLLSIPLFISSADGGKETDSQISVPTLDFSGNVSQEEIEKQVEQIDTGFLTLQSTLLHQMQNNVVPEKNKVYVIYLLGIYHYATAVPILFDNIDYEEPLDEGSIKPDFRMKKWGMYPAVEALVKIGKPASIESIARLAADDGTAKTKYRGFYTTKRELYLIVLRFIEGDDVARFMLQNAIEKEQDKDKKANLTAALELLNKWIKEDAERAKQQEKPAPPAEGGTNPPASGNDGNP